MDGLECSEIMLKEQSFYARIDAEFFSKKNLFLQERLSASGAYPMKKYGALLDCSAFYPSITEYYSHDRSQIPFLRVNEIQNGLISITDRTVFLPEEILAANKKTIAIAYPGDIIIAKGGNTLAKVGLVTNEFPRYATCRDVIILRTDNLKNLNKYFLWAFLHSSYGQGILWRSASQTGQPHLTLPSILEIKIPDITSIQNDIESIYIKSVEKKQQAESLYDAAQKQLLNGLQFVFPFVSTSSISEKKLSDSFRLSGRLDAEYYQPKYSSIIRLLNTKETVESVCQIYDNNYEPENNTEYQYIEIADVGLHGEILLTEKIVGNELPTRARRKVKKGQVVISSIEGSLNSCALITEEFDEALCSTGFYVIDSDKINSETLLVLFQSEPIQELLKQRCSGTILTAISKEEFKKMPLPFIDDVVQKEIAEKVQKAFSMRKKASSLIKIAVKAIELAIEQNEEVATKWLRENVESLEG